MSESPATVRAYQLGDEVSILALFSRVFGRTSSESEWRWKFSENPFAPPLASLAVDADGVVIAQSTLLPVKLNVMGRAVLAAQSIDAMVDERRRGEQLFERTTKHCYENFVAVGGKLVFGFPNRNSYPTLMRKLSRRRVCYLAEYSYRLGVRGVAKKLLRLPPLVVGAHQVYRVITRLRLALTDGLLRARLADSVSVWTSGSAPKGLDDLWDSIRSHEVFSVWKDAEYMAWRYDRAPGRSFTYYCLSEGEQLSGLAVVAHSEGNTASICELLVRDRNVHHAQLLVSRILLEAHRTDKELVRFVGHDSGFFDEVFATFTRQLNFGLIFSVRAFDLPGVEDMVPLQENWTITLGDSDAV